MKQYRSLSLAVGLVLSVAALAAAQQAEPKLKELPNFHIVNTKLYRGGQPQKGGLEKLSTMGIKTIINLRESDEHSQAEEAEARAAGLTYYNIPLSNFGRPSNEQVDKILSLITSSENQPVFVHCKRGSDRTGTVIAIYRISFEGWTSEQATEEAKHYGLGFWQVKMKDYISDYYKQKKK